MKYLLLLLLAIPTFNAQSQNLQQLKDLRAAGSVDHADNILTSWGFQYQTSEDETLKGIIYTITYFHKQSEQIDSDAMVSLFREKEGIGFRLFQVQYVTHSINVFNELKSECQHIDGCVLKKEETKGGDYTRCFVADYVVYNFTISPPEKDGDIPMYMLVINP